MDESVSRMSSTLHHVLGAQARDEHAWSHLTLKVTPWIEAVIRRMPLPPGQDVDDLVQITLLSMFELIADADFPSRDSFKAWVSRIAENRLKDMWRRARAKKRDERRNQALDGGEDGEPLPVQDPGPGPSTIARQVEVRETLLSVLGRLPKADQSVLQLREEEGLDFPELAQRLGYVNVDTARRRFFRAREKRARLLGSMVKRLLDTNVDTGRNDEPGPLTIT